jgi:hypothetical protein
VIQISTIGYRRNYVFPRVLLDVARELFPSRVDADDAIYCLFRSLVSDDLHTVENVAINQGHTKAVKFARERMVRR